MRMHRRGFTEVILPGRTRSGQSQRGPTVLRSVSDTLQHSRERVASRWFALKGVFEAWAGAGGRTGRDATTEIANASAGGVFACRAAWERPVSWLRWAVHFLRMGEKVLLADTTSQGLLPYYFGATELKPGVVRTFSPRPAEAPMRPIHLVSYEVDPLARAGDQSAQDAIANEMVNSAKRRAARWCWI